MTAPSRYILWHCRAGLVQRNTQPVHNVVDRAVLCEANFQEFGRWNYGRFSRMPGWSPLRHAEGPIADAAC